MPEDLKKIKEMATLQQQIHNPKLIDLGDKSEMHNMCAAARASRLPRPPRVQARHNAPHAPAAACRARERGSAGAQERGAV